MRLWQQSMIFLARNKAVKSFMQNRASMSEIAKRFVGGKNVPEVVEKTRALKHLGYKVSLFYLGEYVNDLVIVDQTVTELKRIIHELAAADIEIYISIDPTQIGCQIDENICRSKAFEIAEEIKEAVKHIKNNSRNFLMLDMEDSSVTGKTIQLYEALKEASLPAAVTLQAYLYRTEGDLKKIITNGGIVRLVKGAFAEKKEIAYVQSVKIDNNYIKLSELMFSQEAREKGSYPIFATHDEKIISKIIEIAKSNGWEKGEYEFEMLFGVRNELQKKIIKNGDRLRLYLPFGTDWWPYAVRRIGESPKNLKFLFKSIYSA